MKIFPFTLYAGGICDDSPRLARHIWMRVRPPGLSWYGVDLEVLSEKEVKLHIREIADNFHGGMGEVIHEQVITDLTQNEMIMLETIIRDRQLDLAKEEFNRREARDRKNAIEQLRIELFGK